MVIIWLDAEMMMCNQLTFRNKWRSVILILGFFQCLQTYVPSLPVLITTSRIQSTVLSFLRPVLPDLIVDYDMARKTFAIVQQEDVTNILMNVVDNSSPFSAPDTVKSLEFSYKKEKGAKDNGYHRWKGFSRKYTCEEEEVVSHDGVKVPLTILFSRTAFQKGRSPGLLHGYGAYGEGLDKSWCPDRLSLLDQGWMFAFADVRGGAGAGNHHPSR